MKKNYGIFLDAGSSGTRLQVYVWDSAGSSQLEVLPAELPQIAMGSTDGKEWTTKTNPGIASFSSKPTSVGKDHLKKLLDFAAKVIPESEYQDTPVFLSATAGMRLLPKKQQEIILSNACSYIQDNYNFKLDDCDSMIRVIDGKTEGLYGWLAVNYLLGHLDPKSNQTVGFLDMGGASAQVAFEAPVEKYSNYSDVLSHIQLGLLNGGHLDYDVFLTTWLGFGANEARRRYYEQLLSSARDKSETLSDPCSHKNHHFSMNGASFVGTGDIQKCVSQMNPLLQKTLPCNRDPCLFGGVHVPPIDFNSTEFIGVSEFWHNTHDVFDMGGKYHFPSYYEKVADFCSQDWDSVLQQYKEGNFAKAMSEGKLKKLCFKATWVMSVLHEGFGVPKSNSTIQGHDNLEDGLNVIPSFHSSFSSVNKIEGSEVSWTLGQVLLYASNDVSRKGFATLVPVRPSSNELVFSIFWKAALVLLGVSSLLLLIFSRKQRHKLRSMVRRFQDKKYRTVMTATGAYEEVYEPAKDDVELGPVLPRSKSTSNFTTIINSSGVLSRTVSRERIPRPSTER
ncbi:nucleoside diphosphatase Ynd1 [Schizosaccharomyces japonicus yFS275]|uniref:Nucleoside diphosphatase Ynd1 n=1 Tax=Schizosaccharomyces japonicus (strain yFS275 / FY16936) TaxID=402676 RepID=B6K4W2_SCHJY|nr:nucleoside diphosphatase Ynd1 [Schizosaccharomyces japonicus yFS275]EEB08519.1 nucleoside diphosphatase Ynd1 [Schizosaccharomyces japonicus yFS275]